MRRFMVTYCNEEYECILFSDDEVYIHGSSIVPPEFPDMESFKKFICKHNNNTYPSMRWIDQEELDRAAAYEQALKEVQRLLRAPYPLQKVGDSYDYAQMLLNVGEALAVVSKALKDE